MNGGNSGSPHLHKDGHTKVRWNHLLIGRQVNNALPVEGAIAREGALQDTRVLEDILQVLNTAGGKAPEEGGILKQLHVDISLGGPVLPYLNSKLLNGLAPLMTQLALDLLTRGMGEAIEGGEDVPLVETSLHGGVLVFLSHEVHSLVIQVRGNDGVLGGDPVDSPLIANLEHGEELTSKNSSSAGNPAASLLDQGIDDPGPPDEDRHVSGKNLHAGTGGQGVEGSVDSTENLGVLLTPSESGNLLKE